MDETLKGMGLRSLLKNSTVTLGRQVLAGLLHLATVIVIARAFGPAVNGAFFVALLLPSMLATFLNLGVGPANVYYLGSGQYQARAVFSTCLVLTLWLSALGLSLGALVILFRGEEFFPGVPIPMLWLALLGFPISLAQGFVASIFQGLQQFRGYNLSLLAQPLITFCLILGLVVAGVRDFSFLIVAYVVGAASCLVITLFILRRHLAPDESSERYKLGTALSYGYKAHLSNILAFVNYRADIFLVNLLINPAAAGIYVIAIKISENLWLLSRAVSSVALPRLSQLSGDEATRRRLTPLLSRMVLWVTTLGAVVLALIAFPLIRILFGEQFAGGAWPLIVLLPGVIALSASRVLSNDIAARGKPEINMYMSIITVTVNILGNVLLIPIYGLIGAAFATTVAYVLNLCTKLFVYWHLTAISPWDVLLLKRQDIAGLKRAVREPV